MASKHSNELIPVGHKHPAPVAITLVRTALSALQIPTQVHLRYTGMQRKAGSGQHHIRDGVVWVQASWSSMRGVQQTVDVPVVIADGYALAPELLVTSGGATKVIAQSTIDELTNRTQTYARDPERKHLYAPPPDATPSAGPKPQIGLGLYGKHAQAMSPQYPDAPQKQEREPQPPTRPPKPPGSGTPLPPRKELPEAAQPRQPRGEPEPTKAAYEELGLRQFGGYDNIKAVLAKATPHEIGFHRRWYKSAHGDVKRLAEHYGLPLDVVAGVVAAISPNMPWPRNIANAQRILDGEDRTEAYPRETERAKYVLRTGDLGPLKRGDWGPKIGPFYESLASPWEANHRAVIDGHAANIWFGGYVPVQSKAKTQSGNDSTSIKGVKPTDKQRAEMMNDYARAGADYGLSAQEAQAVSWVLWRQMVDRHRKQQQRQAQLQDAGGANLVHYSTTPGLSTLDPAHVGSGQLSNRERQDTRVPVTFFYFDGTEPERLITSRSNARYTAKLPPNAKLLDLASTPDWVRAAAKQDGRGGMYAAIKERGYFGFYNTASDLPNAVAVFYPMAVTETPFHP